MGRHLQSSAVGLVDDRLQLLGGVLPGAGRAGVRHDATRGHNLDHPRSVLDLVADSLAHLRHPIGDSLLHGEGQHVGGQGLEHGGIEVAAGGTDGVSGRDDPGPVDPSHVDGLHEGHVEQEAAGLYEQSEISYRGEAGSQRALAVGHGAQGSERRILLDRDQRAGVVGPTHEQVDLHVHQSRQQGHVPQVDLRRSGRDGGGGYADDTVTLDQQVTGLHQLAALDVQHAGADQVDGRLRCACSCHVGSFRNGRSVSPRRNIVFGVRKVRYRSKGPREEFDRSG